MRVGFTGTRDGLTNSQVVALARWLTDMPTGDFHHGACIGADSHAADIADSMGLLPIAHPSDITSMTCQAAIRVSRTVFPVKRPLDRNHNIVDETDILIACPKGMVEERRSGTWATIRYARKKGKRTVILWPDGTVTEEAANQTHEEHQ